MIGPDWRPCLWKLILPTLPLRPTSDGHVFALSTCHSAIGAIVGAAFAKACYDVYVACMYSQSIVDY
eukprot:5404957-Amphidinium_carterae.1